MNELIAAGLVLGGLLGGVAFAWLLLRGKSAAEVTAAVVQAESRINSELIQLRERVRSSDETHNAEQGQYERLQQQAEKWRIELDDASNTIARLTERALRVPELDSKISALSQAFDEKRDELRRVAEEGAQQRQHVLLLSQQIQGLEREGSVTKQRLEQCNTELGFANERKAALEEQANRLPGMEQALKHAGEQLDAITAELARERQTSGAELARLKASLSAEQTAHDAASKELNEVKVARDVANREVAHLAAELKEVSALFEAEKSASQEKLALLTEAKQTLTEQFKNLANDILEQKSKHFIEQNQTSLGHLLDPLRTQLSEFKGKVEEVYVQEGKDRSALAEQVRNLMNLNQALSQDAKNLTTALKGSVKAQGNWGELILSRVLEESGLRKDHEYHVQESQKREDGSRAQPDVVIYLPEERRLVVDSKVSLIAYDEHVRAETDEQRQIALQRHLDSIRGHIRDLSTKEYQKLYDIKSLDFVLMFVPIEPAFHLAIGGDDNLFMNAWEKNVLLVCPSTLLFVVRTVAHLWRQEAQSRNAQDIAKRGAELYDKLVDFVKDLEGVGKKLREAQDNYDSAHKRLATGKGNVIRQAQMLRELGVKPSKALAVPLVETASLDDDIVVMSELSQIAAANTPRA